MKTFEQLVKQGKTLMLSGIAACFFLLLTGCPFIVEIKTDDTVIAGEIMNMPVIMASDGRYTSWFTLELLLPDGWSVKNDSISHDDGINNFVVKIDEAWELPYPAPEGYYWWSGMARNIVIQDDQIFEVNIPLVTGSKAGKFELALFIDYDCSGAGPCALDNEPRIEVETLSSDSQPYALRAKQDNGTLILNWNAPKKADNVRGYYVYIDDKTEPISQVISGTTFNISSPQLGIHNYQVASVIGQEVHKSSSLAAFFGEEIWVSSTGSNENDGANRLEALQSLDYAMDNINPDANNPVIIRMANDTLRIASDYGNQLSFKDHVKILGQGQYSVLDLKESRITAFLMDYLDNVSFEKLSILNASDGIFYAWNSKIEFVQVDFLYDNYVGNLRKSEVKFFNCLFENSGFNTGTESSVNYDNSVLIYSMDNYYPGLEGGSRTYTNSILWGAPNISPNYLQSNNYLSVEVNYSSVKGGHQVAAIDPLFDHSVQPYRLGQNSLCIDAGNPDEAYFDAVGTSYQGMRTNDLGIYGGPYARRSNLVLGVKQENSADLSLNNYPNPAMDYTTIQYYLDKGQQVELSLTSTDGQQRSLLFNDFKTSGWHEQEINVADLNSGIYLLQLNTSNQRQVHRMIIQ